MSGSNGQVRFGIESSEGVPWHDSWFTPFISESFRMERPSEPNPNIDGSGSLLRGDNLQATGTGTLIVAPNSEDLLPIRAVQHEHHEVSTPAVGVKLWEFRDFDAVEDTPVAYYDESLWFGLWRDQRDDPSEYKVFGAKPSQLQITVDAFKHLRFQHDFLFLRDTYSRVVFEDVDPAFTGELFVQGHRILGDEAGDDDYFKIKIVDDGPLEDSTFVWGKGTDPYGTTEYPIMALMDVMTAADLRYAPREEPYQIRWVDVVGSEFTADDEFRIYPSEPTKPVATLSQRPKLNAAKLDFEMLVNGVTLSARPIDQFTISHITPREALGGVGAKYYQTIDRPNDARDYWQLTFASTYLDRKLEQALISGGLADAHVKFYGGYIGVTGLEDFGEYTLDDMWFTEAGIEGVTQPGRLPENVTLQGSTCVERWQNTIASIAPTA